MHLNKFLNTFFFFLTLKARIQEVGQHHINKLLLTLHSRSFKVRKEMEGDSERWRANCVFRAELLFYNSAAICPTLLVRVCGF